MSDVTLFELNFHDGFEFAPSSTVGNAPRVKDGETEGEAVADDGDDTDDESGVGAPSLVVLLLVVAVVLLAAKRLTGDDGAELEELDDLEG